MTARLSKRVSCQSIFLETRGTGQRYMGDCVCNRASNLCATKQKRLDIGSGSEEPKRCERRAQRVSGRQRCTSSD